MKSKLWYLLVNFLLISMVCVLFSVIAEGNTVVNQQDNSEIGIAFSEGKEPPKEIIDPDNIYKPSPSKEIKNLLPETGETILSFIIILLGFSVVLLVVGVVSIKRTMKINKIIY